MIVFVVCEYSNIVADAFRKKGHYVVSCDLEPNDVPGTSHYIGDCFTLLENFKPDMLLAFPPCTYLAKVQSQLCSHDQARQEKRLQAAEFFKKLYHQSIPKIAIENPAGFMNTHFLPPSQIITPWYFGDPYQKEICLWLKGLPPLISTVYSTKRRSTSNHVNSRMSQEQKSKIKSKFFPGVADAMASQWS